MTTDHLADLVTTMGWVRQLPADDRESVEALADAFRGLLAEQGGVVVIAMKLVSLEAFSGHLAQDLTIQ